MRWILGRKGPAAALGAPYSVWMALCLLLYLPLMGLSQRALGADSSQKLKKSDARVTVVVCNFEGEPIPGVTIDMKGVDVDLNLAGQSDEKGQYIVVVPQGKTFDVTCGHDGNTFKFGEKAIPKVNSPLNYTLKLSIKASSQASQKSNMPPGHTQVHVTVRNSLDQPEPDVEVSFEGVDTNENYMGRTDYNGKWDLTLPRGRNFVVKADKYDVLFDLGAHPIPMVDVFHLNLKLIIERSVLARASAAKVHADAPEADLAQAAQIAEEAAANDVVVSISVFDAHKNPESDAKLTLTDQTTGEVITGETDSVGRLILLLPGQRDYDLQVAKYEKVHQAGIHHVPSREHHEIGIQTTLTSKYLETYRLENVYFDTAKATLRPESYPPLTDLFKVLNDNPSMVIELAGHTDSRGDDLYNLKLSRDRANSVRDFLIKKGIEKERLAAKGYGEFEPVAENSSADGMQLNRRTEVRIIAR